MKIKTPKFFLKSGHWGEHGWKRVNFFKWFVNQFNYVNKAEWS